MGGYIGIGYKHEEEKWSSSDFTEAIVLIPRPVLAVVKAIISEMDGHEFTVLFKGGWTAKGYLVSEEYYIPKQKVTRSSVDFTDPDEITKMKREYPVALHTHPWNTRVSFSSADEDYINQTFECSLLSNIDGEIVDARLRVLLRDGLFLRLYPEVRYIIPPAEVNPEEIKRKIEIERVTYGYGYGRKTSTWPSKYPIREEKTSKGTETIKYDYGEDEDEDNDDDIDVIVLG